MYSYMHVCKQIHCFAHVLICAHAHIIVRMCNVVYTHAYISFVHFMHAYMRANTYIWLRKCARFLSHAYISLHICWSIHLHMYLVRFHICMYVCKLTISLQTCTVLPTCRHLYIQMCDVHICAFIFHCGRVHRCTFA
jgi:hypothetical protein